MCSRLLPLLVLSAFLVCALWVGCLAMDSLRFEAGDPCIEEASAVAMSYGPRYSDLAARLGKAPPGSPEAQRLLRECQALRAQVADEVRAVYRRHGREMPPR
jgi:hypothetical protein